MVEMSAVTLAAHLYIQVEILAFLHLWRYQSIDLISLRFTFINFHIYIYMYMKITFITIYKNRELILLNNKYIRNLE